jgi:hypothetical protein
MYDIVAVMKREEDCDVLIYVGKQFATEEAATNYINEGADMEMFSQAFTADTEQDPDLAGFWLDEFAVRPALKEAN